MRCSWLWLAVALALAALIGRFAALASSARLSVDGLSLGMSVAAVRARLRARRVAFRENSNVEVAYLLGGSHFVIDYDAPASLFGEAVFTRGVVQQLSGCSLQASGVTVLQSGDMEKKALEVLGPYTGACPETGNTTGDYWDSPGLALLIHSDWSQPEFLRTYTVREITLATGELR